MKSKKDKQVDDSLVGHLTELRRHLIVTLGLFLLVVLLAFQYADVLVADLISKSIHTQFVYLSPAELFTTYMRSAMVAGLVVCLPFFLFRLWIFVKPGLLAKEIKVIAWALVAGFLLFVLGLLFAYLLVLPMTLNFLASFQTPGVKAAIGFSNYFNYVMNLVFSIALVFELPILIVLLVSLGILTPAVLTKNRKYALLAITILAAVITPPDVISQILLILPMVLLMEAGIFFSKVIYRRKKQRISG